MFDLTKIVSLSFLFAPSLKMQFYFQSSGQDMGLIVGLQLLIQQLKGGNMNLDGPLTLEQMLHSWSQAMRLEVKLQMQRKSIDYHQFLKVYCYIVFDQLLYLNCQQIYLV